MKYKVMEIQEDVDFGCEERSEEGDSVVFDERYELVKLL